MKKMITLVMASSLLAGSLAVADAFVEQVQLDTVTMVAAIALAGAGAGYSTAKATKADSVTPKMLQDSVGKLQNEIGHEATSNLIQSMNNCNDPESISVPANALTAKKVVSAYSEVFDKCIGK